jgi:Tol biopolymer transport system component
MFNEGGPQQPGGTNIYVMGLEGDRTPRTLFANPAGEQDGQISPDGRWVAYMAPVSSRQEIYVTPFPGPGPRWQVSTNGGGEPRWSHDGRELYFQNGEQLMGVTVNAGATFSASAPHLVHEGRFLKSVNGNTSWDVTPDGKRFVRIQQVEPERPVTRIDLVLNWFDELAGGAAPAR